MQFSAPWGLALGGVSPQTGTRVLFVADSGNNRLRRMELATGATLTVAGIGTAGSSDGPWLSATMNSPRGVGASALTGAVFSADFSANKLRSLNCTPSAPTATPSTTPSAGASPAASLTSTPSLSVTRTPSATPTPLPAGCALTPFAGALACCGFSDGPALSSVFYYPGGLASNATASGGFSVWVADTSNHRVRAIIGGTVTTIAGTGVAGLVNGAPGQLSSPGGVAVSTGGSSGATLWVADTGNHAIRAIALPSGGLTTLCGTGSPGWTDNVATAAMFYAPQGLVALGSSGSLLIADSLNNRVRVVALPSGTTTTLAGTGIAGGMDGTGTGATFNAPRGIAALSASGPIAVTDFGGNRVRLVTLQGGVTTLCGSGVAGWADGSGMGALFNAPQGLLWDPFSSSLLVADGGGNRLRAVTWPAGGGGGSGVVTTLAGSGTASLLDGWGGAATLSTPIGLALGPLPGQFYVTDSLNSRVRALTCTPPTPTPTPTPSLTLGATASGTPSATALPTPSTTPSPTPSSQPAACTVNTTAGTGAAGWVDAPLGLSAAFNSPYGVAAGPSDLLFVADTTSNRIRTVAAGSGGGGAVSTLAGSGSVFWGDGSGSAAGIQSPLGLSYSASAALLGVVDGSGRVRTVTLSGAVTTLAGSGVPGFMNGAGTAAQFSSPKGIAWSEFGGVTQWFVADCGNARVRAVAHPSGTTSTLAGGVATGSQDGTGGSASFICPTGLALSPSSGALYVADATAARIRVVDPGGVVTTLAGTVPGYSNGPGGAAAFSSPTGLVLSPDGAFLYVADAGNYGVRVVQLATGIVSTAAGAAGAGWVDGLGGGARFNTPRGLAILPAAGLLLVADQTNNRLRALSCGIGAQQTATPTSSPGASASPSAPPSPAPPSASPSASPGGCTVVTFAGTPSTVGAWLDGAATSARFSSPEGLAVHPSGNVLVADRGNNRVRLIAPTGAVSTFAGTGAAAWADGAAASSAFNTPSGVAMNASQGLGGMAYVADSGNNRIRAIDLSMAFVSTLAGSGTATYAEGVGSAASFYFPEGLALAPGSMLLVADANNHRCALIPFPPRTPLFHFLSPSARFLSPSPRFPLFSQNPLG